MKLQSPTLKQYYELLGVTETASPVELKRAYHQMALLYHPDRNPDIDAAAQFQKVREAFDVVSDQPRVQALKRNHLKERLFDQCIDGLTFSFGAFFGYRVFATVADHLPSASAEVDIESDRSILDDPAYDSIEVVYAGRLSREDEEHLTSAGRRPVDGALPWVVLNNAGILDFLDGRYGKALRCYEELNRRIPGNIIFLYREALCHIILGFQSSRRDLLGRKRPDVVRVKKGLGLLRRCIFLGETRPVGKQSCLVIRKFMADVLEKLGNRRAVTKIWKQIAALEPRSVEAKMKTGFEKEARALLVARKRLAVPIQSVNRALLAVGRR